MAAESCPCQSGVMVICNDVARLPGWPCDGVPVAGVAGGLAVAVCAPGAGAFSARGAGFQRNTGTSGDEGPGLWFTKHEMPGPIAATAPAGRPACQHLTGARHR